MANETMQIAIYKIETEYEEFEKMNNDEIISFIINKYNENLHRSERLVEQPLKKNILEDFNIKVFYSTKKSEPKWKGFLAPIVEDNARLLRGKNEDVSFVAFIYKDEHMFSITGGQGNFCIQKFIDPFFGLNIISRIITNNSPVIKSINERGIAGTILASTKLTIVLHMKMILESYLKK